MATPHFPTDIQASLRQLLDNTTSGPTPSIPGLVYSAIDRNGDIIFNHASGSRGLSPYNRKNPMTLDTIFWIASCTKMLTAIACMQLVEQGKLNLDDVEQVEKLARELKDVKVLEGDLSSGFRLVEKERGITLRMLLNHTAGFGYPFSHSQLRDYSLPIGYDEFAGHTNDVLGLPLINQPGTKFDYGVNIDWAGVLVERVTGLSLNDYFQKHIFEPLGIKDISFFPDKDMKSRLAYMHRREEKDGSLHVTDHIYRFALMERKNSDGPEERFCSGGAGCFGTVGDYCKIIAVLLNNGTCPKTKAQILKPETVDEMYKDQIPNKPRYINQPFQTAKPHLAKHIPFRPLANPAQAELETEGWGLTFALNHEGKESGRKPFSASWEGIANLFWFADRESGVGGMIGSQILPYGDNAVLDVNDAVEKLVYTGLKRTEDMYK
ncbi:beta-lactamase family protein [Talaromyces stipitatus ATCC 10500]|uniref:Beta-lactamase family protein n=1 Tax=Talaromyces stipitatus (strain ATCC 10500 / CBS 375.48 / QM 6759 / NRRL 1006) TaxID=441959 RepID=B8MHW4_TALSN|nr:beta-lactamase family protein [Talaromyces stipitatus ATCC 10500]EED16444.1 beta-lactamase family protein [Talaromyces stipitatus ATCC 10500]